MKKLLKVFCIMLIPVFLVTGCGEKTELKESEPPKKEEKKLKIVDLDSDSRSYAVMINNHNQARENHAGLQDAYIVYEIVVEGGITRFMALFRDVNPEKIGSTRSARHYYLDYAMENDAIYVHFGGSDPAYNQISSLKINDLDGNWKDRDYFYRDQDIVLSTGKKPSYEHTAFTSMAELKKAALANNFRTTSTQDLLLQYSIEEISLEEKEGSIVANTVTIPYSDYMTTSYQYDEENKNYKRFANGAPHKDGITKEQYTVKNIIVAQIENVGYNGNYLQDLKNITTGKGYYITDGYAVEITWEKTSRSAQTVYRYLNGEEIVVNDGNTFIQIQPIKKETTFQ